MMTRTEITLEMDRLIIINREPKEWSWCSACMSDVEMISVNEAALRAEVNSRDIVDCLKTGLLHYKKSCEGKLLVCANSLSPE